MDGYAWVKVRWVTWVLVVGDQSDSEPVPPLLWPTLLAVQAALGERHAEAALTWGAFAVGLAPVGIRVVDGLGRHDGAGVLYASLGQEGADDVHLVAVVGGGHLDGVWF